MTEKEAYAVLGLAFGAKKEIVKKKYRQLMLLVHPDVDEASRGEYGHTVQEINAAYEIIMKGSASGAEREGHQEQNCGTDGNFTGEKESPWNASVNENAYAMREILHYVEDYDGKILGDFCIARGKYLWQPEEDFPLFLKSIYRCGKELLDEIDDALQRGGTPEGKQEIQAELTYLLAQQFIDVTGLLGELGKELEPDQEGNRIFFLPAMLELSGKDHGLREADPLLPAGVRRHRLYLKNQDGQELGYLSFRDDRLYYAVIPLFEQRRVQVRIRAGAKRPQKGRKARSECRNLKLWLRLCEKDAGGLPENLNLQIERLLARYRGVEK